MWWIVYGIGVVITWPLLAKLMSARDGIINKDVQDYATASLFGAIGALVWPVTLVFLAACVLVFAVAYWLKTTDKEHK